MDIISLPIELDKEKIDSRFRLVTISTQRAIELSKGSKLRIQTRNKKITTNAILEALTGNVEFLTGEEARINLEKAEKLDYRRWVTEKKKPIADITDLEKDLKVYLVEHEKESSEDALYMFEGINEKSVHKKSDEIEEKSEEDGNDLID